MKLSTRLRYGCRAMVALALHQNDGPLSLEAMAEGQHIPERYLARIIQDLRRSGLIRSVRGAHGGYVLSRPPAQVTLLQVWEALEGRFGLVDCLDSPAICEVLSECVMRDVWGRMRGAVEEVLSSETLGGLIRRQKARPVRGG